MVQDEKVCPDCKSIMSFIRKRDYKQGMETVKYYKCINCGREIPVKM
jgi:hypothetical protein